MSNHHRTLKTPSSSTLITTWHTSHSTKILDHWILPWSIDTQESWPDFSEIKTIRPTECSTIAHQMIQVTRWSMEPSWWVHLWSSFLRWVLTTHLRSSSHIIHFLSTIEMQAKVIVSIIVHFCNASKVLSLLSSLAGMILEASTSKSMSTMRELKTEISTGSSQASLLPSWVQLNKEMQDIDMVSIQTNIVKSLKILV